MKTAIVVEHQTMEELTRIKGFAGVLTVAGQPLHVSLIDQVLGQVPDCVQPAPPTPKGRRYKGTTLHPGFEEFWAAYPKRCPRRVRSTAMAAWDKERPPLDEVLIALAWQDESYDWQREGGQSIPGPSVWINQRRWEMEKPESEGYDF